MRRALVPVAVVCVPVCVTVVMTSTVARANQEFVPTIPNGATFNCTACHTAPNGGEGWNTFGQDLLEAGGANPDANPDDQNDGYSGTPLWSDVCDVDSDGDGYTNGEELGDPECAWVEGDANPTGPVSNPGNETDFPGDGSLCASTGTRAMTVGAMPVVALGLGLGAMRRRRRQGLSLNAERPLPLERIS